MSEIKKAIIDKSIHDASNEVEREIDQMMESGEFDRMVDSELKKSETFFDKVLNLYC